MNSAVWFRNALFLAFVCVWASLNSYLIGQDAANSAVAKAVDPPSPQLAERLPDELRPANFDVKDIAVANTVVESMHLADWLGPLAPVALSPFFGLACLSGLAIWGPDWMAGNALLLSAGVLKSELVFGVFVGLTLLTSVPRLMKVSKPLAQALDQLETYSVIIILVVIKLFAVDGPEAEAAPIAAIRFGFLSFTADSLLAIAMVINLIVINSVKFFFEILIWLTPIPAVDAMFEIANKSVCAALMALYAFSPSLATLINLAMFFAALIVFRWIHRRLSFYRRILIDLFLSRIWKGYGLPRTGTVEGFVKCGRSPFLPKTRWRLSRDDDSWEARRSGGIRRACERLDVIGRPQVRRGWITHTLVVRVSESETIEFHVSRRYDDSFEEWLGVCGIELDQEREMTHRDVETVRAEFA